MNRKVKLNRFIEKRLKNIKWGKVLVLSLTPLTTFIVMQFVYSGAFTWFSMKVVFANVIVIGCVYWLMCAIFKRIGWMSLFCHLLFIALGAGNAFVYQYRGNPILPWDLMAIRTAMAVSKSYTFVPSASLLFSLMGVLIVFGATYRFWGKKKDQLQDKGVRLFLLGAALVCALPMMNVTWFRELGATGDVWNQAKAYKNHGILAAFFDNCRYLDVELPEGYTEEGWEEAMSHYQTSTISTQELQETEVKPHIIAIMNESWADFEGFGNLTLNQDVMDFIPTLSGYNELGYASVFGAGTSASEFEFLTGNSMAFLPPGSIPYQQYILENQESLASILKAEGYQTLAIHPGENSSWQRNQAYPLLGFDEFISAEGMSVPLTYNHGGYISDESNYAEIIAQFENRSDEGPLFIFNVTIQNHGSYTDESYTSMIEIEDGSFPMAEQYLSLVKQSDDAFEALIHYFEVVDEPVIIVMFGDHQPALEQEFFDLAYGVIPKEMDMGQYMDKYRVPLVLWSNQDELTLEGPISLNFLGQKVLEAAHIEGSAYRHYLDEVSSTLPVLTFNGYMDIEGESYSHLATTEFDSLIDQFQIMEYGQLFHSK